MFFLWLWCISQRYFIGIWHGIIKMWVFCTDDIHLRHENHFLAEIKNKIAFLKFVSKFQLKRNFNIFFSTRPTKNLSFLGKCFLTKLLQLYRIMYEVFDIELMDWWKWFGRGTRAVLALCFLFIFCLVKISRSLWWNMTFSCLCHERL